MILPMARVQLLGPRDLLPEILEFVQGEGVLELRAPEQVGPQPSRPAQHGGDAGADGEGGEASLADQLARTEALLARLPAASVQGPAGRAEQDRPSATRLAVLGSEVPALAARRAALVEERDATDRFSRLVAALAPLRHALDPALQPEIHGLVLREDPETLALLQGEVARITGGRCEVQARPLDEEHTGILVVVPRAHGRALTQLLFERGVDEVKLPAACNGKGLFDVLLHLSVRAREIPAEIARADEALAVAGVELAGLAASLRGALERRRALSRCAETRFACVVAGYMPAERLPALRAAARERLGDRVAVLAEAPARGAWGEVPVVLRNRTPLRPFQLLLALVPLPRYGSVDPTPWLAFFFPLFFGLVLGDVAFGLLGIAVALVARRRGWGGSVGRELAWIALACSLSAAIFGLLFGEALGELGAHLGLHPVLMDRRHAFMSFLGLALAIGGAHVAIGSVLGVASALRRGHRREAVARTAKLLLLGASATAVLALLGLVPRAVAPPAAIVGGAFLLVAIGAEGPMAALDLVLGLGNVLSYARLMALGLASVMLAEVANLVAGALRPAAAGLAIAALLHAVNFTLGLISPTVAALRLHYVEFFEKFYEEGGEPYRPFVLT